MGMPCQRLTLYDVRAEEVARIFPLFERRSGEDIRPPPLLVPPPPPTDPPTDFLLAMMARRAVARPTLESEVRFGLQPMLPTLSTASWVGWVGWVGWLLGWSRW